MEDGEHEYGIRLSFPDGTSERFNRKSMELRTYFGKLAVYDHIWLTRTGQEEDGTEKSPMVIFETKPIYKDMLEFILRNNFPMHMNMIQASPHIVELYENDAKKDLGDTIPEDW